MKPEILKPSHKLAKFIECYWTLEANKGETPIKNTIVPDGTIKLIFHYGDPYKHHFGSNSQIMLPRCFLIGQLTKPYVVEPTGNTGTFVVRFQPGGFLPFSNVRIKNMENKAIPLEDLFGLNGKELGRSIIYAKNTAERIILVESFLLKYLQDQQLLDITVINTVNSILSNNGQLSITEYSKKYNITRRQLTRKFTNNIGLSPKQLARTVRIQTCLQKLLNSDINRLSDLAYENDFFDQAHFIKDFKEFTGITPKEFYGDSLKMSLIFERK